MTRTIPWRPLALALALLAGCTSATGAADAPDASPGIDGTAPALDAMDATDRTGADIGPDGDPSADAATSPDTSVAGDTASPPDTSDPADTSVPADTASPPDTAVPADTSGPADTASPADTSDPVDTASPPDTSVPADTTSPPDTSVPADTAGAPDAADPCAADPTDSDGDGLVDGCDACPEVPRVLVYGVNSDHQHGLAAVALLGCEHTVAGVDDFVALLTSGDYGAVVLDMPDARPEGDWAAELLDFVAGGGVALLSTWRPEDVPGPSLAATFGAWAGPDASAPRAFRPTWYEPLFTRPFDLSDATFAPDPAANATYHGPTLAVAAGRAFARFDTGAAIVQSNGGRTFIDGFLWDDYVADDDSDGVADVVELVANQLVAASRARLPAADHDAPEVANFPAEGAVVRYDLPILRGDADDAAAFVTVYTNGDVRAWPIADGRLKALTPLEVGENYVSISDRGRTTYLTLDYQPQQNPRRVRLVYALASDGDGSFDAPVGEPSDLSSATRRLALGGRLLQSMVGDRLAEAGLGRRTFRLQRDAAGQVEVIVWHTSIDTTTWWGMEGAALFSWVWQHQSELPPCDACKTVVVLGMTHFDPSQGGALAHTALGGGGVALFGSATLYAWAQSLDELVPRLYDATFVSALSPTLLDDSGLRGTLWANYATGLGAVLHELGHALNLPHPTDAAAIQNRGFDHVNRLLVVSEPGSATTAGVAAIWPTAEPGYALTNAARLRYHRWLALDDVPYGVTAPPTVAIVGDEVRVASPAGIRVVSYGRAVPQPNGSVDYRVAGGQVQTGGVAPSLFTLSVAQLRLLFPNDAELRLRVTDDQGNFQDDAFVPLTP